MVDLPQADRLIDKTDTSQWDLVLIKKGTGNLGVGVELLRQELFDVDGNPWQPTGQLPKVGHRGLGYDRSHLLASLVETAAQVMMRRPTALKSRVVLAA